MVELRTGTAAVDGLLSVDAVQLCIVVVAIEERLSIALVVTDAFKSDGFEEPQTGPVHLCP
jgi:hypothetical protein